MIVGRPADRPINIAAQRRLGGVEAGAGRTGRTGRGVTGGGRWILTPMRVGLKTLFVTMVGLFKTRALATFWI